MKWKKIGLICGAGPLAGADIYKKLIEECSLQGAVCDHDYPEVLMYNSPFLEVGPEGEVERESAKALCKAVSLLDREGVEVFGLGCNSLHSLVPQTQMEFVSTPVCVASALSPRCRKAGLIATAHTIQTKIYEKAVGAKAELVYPTARQQEEIDECISLVLGYNYAKSAAKLERLGREMLDDADAIILGCSELPLANPHLEKTVDCNTALATGLVKAALVGK